ncbi:helix-hairpin-helix domain-containing protein [Lactobacillus sp. YT155]|uniref:helix-hairpin-helix domain-containing protein n=1 Tax=Lactobacillus sp. YT155 TaxID=3060955 RepID=UPI00265E965F|nr:helix-hairpin-helix domain-containing protein [Lactobacillus sp. YT155]MDO1605308.1 helix-hairpin-helix domain-containing protein [Lactobacillus sp. YT155]
MIETIKEKFLERKIEYLVIGGLIVILVGMLILGKSSTATNDKKDVFENTTTTVKQVSKKSSATIYVDVQGEVNKPGFYRLKTNARVFDLLQLAGGLTKDADRKNVNQAKKLSDQEQVYIPKIGEIKDNPVSTSTNENQEQTGSEEKININKASVDDFQKLNGIGAKKAEQIVKFRNENGDFQKVEDLTKVTGIGDKTLKSLQDQITV